MGLFDIFKTNSRKHQTTSSQSSNSSTHYDMDSLEGIRSIPVPAKNYSTGDPTKDCIYYVLQRKATEHKKNGKMDLAIACLRKSNELSDYEPRPLLLEKDYLRLVKYIASTGNTVLAQEEEKKIYTKHPEFLDKRINNKKSLDEILKKQRRHHSDLIFIKTNQHCPTCKRYNHKIYSITGKTKKYPTLPNEFRTYGGFCKDCSVCFSVYFEGISQP